VQSNVTKTVPQTMATKSGPYRVMVVDDSAVIRGLIARWLEAEDAVTIVGTASNGAMALKSLKSQRPEIVVLDIEMPEMDGLTALPKIIEEIPGVQVIMASTLTKRNAEVSMKALARGAADYIPKPESSREVSASSKFRDELINKVKALGAAARRQSGGTPFAEAEKFSAQRKSVVAGRRKISDAPKLRSLATLNAKILAIGSSTGGPQALQTFLSDIKKPIKVPVVITQHMPPTFTTILAQHLTQSTKLPCKEAADGDVLEAGKVYIAPGDFHMRIISKDGHKVIKLDQDAPVNFCRPAVDPMFDSIVSCYGADVLGVILTGMGQDGMNGCHTVVKAGGAVLAQDEKSSVVWGMPGAVSEAGLCNELLPLDQIGKRVSSILIGGGK